MADRYVKTLDGRLAELDVYVSTQREHLINNAAQKYFGLFINHLAPTKKHQKHIWRILKRFSTEYNGSSYKLEYGNKSLHAPIYEPFLDLIHRYCDVTIYKYCNNHEQYQMPAPHCQNISFSKKNNKDAGFYMNILTRDKNATIPICLIQYTHTNNCIKSTLSVKGKNILFSDNNIHMNHHNVPKENTIFIKTIDHGKFTDDSLLHKGLETWLTKQFHFYDPKIEFFNYLCNTDETVISCEIMALYSHDNTPKYPQALWCYVPKEVRKEIYLYI